MNLMTKIGLKGKKKAERNREWREENEWKETEILLMAELVCPICDEEMLPPKQIYQCGMGHVLCQHCVGRDGPKVIYTQMEKAIN